MEQVNETCKASKSEPVDVISNMPDNVITNILDRLPLQEAVRTDILSRNWKYKWTMLTQLVFDLEFFGYLQKHKSKSFDGKDLGRLLLQLNGTITKFFLVTPDRSTLTVDDINHCFLFLCRKGIKELAIINTRLEKPPKLHFDACMELKHLALVNCDLCFLPTFRGFPNLLSLDLTLNLYLNIQGNEVNFGRVKFERCDCGEFIARCPSLEILKILDFQSTCTLKLNLGAIAKLVNLKLLCFPLCALDNTMENTSSSILQLMCHLPKLQHLYLDFFGCKFIAEGSVTNKFPAPFLCLGTLALLGIDFSSDNTIVFIIDLISGSPNLKNLVIKAMYEKDAQLQAPSSLDFDCNTMGQLQLQSVELHRFKGSESEALLIKYILACSPLLNKIVIKFDSSLINVKFASKLLKFRRASTEAEIDLS